MKKKAIVKSTFVIMMASLLAIPTGGCGSQNNDAKAQQVSTEVGSKLTEKDLEGIITGLDDHYILENAKNIDYLHGIKYDEEIIKDVKVDNKEVKLSKTGKYTATYTVSVDVEALQRYQDEKAAEEEAASKDEEQADKEQATTDAGKDTVADDTSTSSKDETDSEKEDTENKDATVSTDATDKDETGNESSAESDKSDNADDKATNDKEDTAGESDAGSKEETDEKAVDETDQIDDTDTVKNDADTGKDDKEQDGTIEDVEIDKEIEVVDKETAEDLADKGEVVWTDDNDTVPKTDGSKVEEVVEEPESTKPAEDNTASSDNGNTNNTTASTGSGNTGNTGGSGSSGNSGNSSPAPSQPAGCSHNWQPEYTKGEAPGHWVDDYTTVDVILCHCGERFPNGVNADGVSYDVHAAFYCPVGGYTVIQEQQPTGTQHWEATGPAPDVPTGRYICFKCGALK
nr:hypothetical protein [Lachnoclostridium phocaeense]